MASRSTGGCPVENDPLTFLSASAARMNPLFVPKLICQSLYPKACIQKLAHETERFERPRFRTDRKPLAGCDDCANCGRDRGSIRAVQSPKTFVNTVNCGIQAFLKAERPCYRINALLVSKTMCFGRPTVSIFSAEMSGNG